MAAQSRSHLARYGPHVLIATFFVAVFPLLAVYALESSGTITSPIVATVVGVGLSVGIARLGSFLWVRHSGSRDLVFGDLMLWGWVRRMRTEVKLSNSIKLLGLDRTGTRLHEVENSPERQNEILRGLANALETGDPFTHGHTRRVTRYSYMLAKTMRLPHETVQKIRAAAAVHDVGKIQTPSEILNKPGALTDDEFEVMKRHPAVGSEMVEKLGDPEITAMVRHHHERIDGKGYPDRLAGDEIPLGAKVIAVADTFDAIISTRPYRSARRHKDAIEILERVAGTQLDERTVYAFLSYYSGRKPLAWWLSFSAGVQRVLGGMGGWLQHAQAASQGTLSLAAAVALTSASLSIPAIGDVRDRARHDNSNKAKVVAIEYTAAETLASDSVGGYDIAPGPGLGSPRSRFAPAARAQEDVRLASLESDASDGLVSEPANEDAPSESSVASTDPGPQEPAPQEFDAPEEEAPGAVDPAPPLPEVPGGDAKNDGDPVPGDGCENDRPGKPGKEVAKSSVPPGRGKDEDCDDDGEDDDDDEATDDDTNTDKSDTDDVTDTDNTNHDTTDSVDTGGPGDDTDDTGADNDSNGNGNDSDDTADTDDEVVPPEADELSAGDDGESAESDVVLLDPETPEVVEPEAPEDVEPEAPEVVEPEVPEVVIPETPETKPVDEEAVD